MAQKPMTKTQLVAAMAEKMDVDKKIRHVRPRRDHGHHHGRGLQWRRRHPARRSAKSYCRERPERMVRNPATGEQFKKDADKVVKMTIAKALKDSVNE